MIAAHRIRQRLSEGKQAFGIIVNFDSPWFMDLLAIAGFDFVLIDAEHGPLLPPTVEPMCRAAEAVGMSAIVRVPGGDPYGIQRYLDVGAVGIQVPHIETVEAAKAGVDATRYPPEGHRGLATHTRAANYGATMSASDYMHLANREIGFYATIETELAVKNIDTIAAVPGLDGLCIGPGDMSASMGLRGDRSAPAVQTAIRRVIESAKAHGKWVSLPATDIASAQRAIELGVDFVQFPANYIVLNYGRQFLAEMRKER